MLDVLFVVFRECLEIALLLSIIAATIGPMIENFTWYIVVGVMSGTILSAITGFFVQFIATNYDGIQEEIAQCGVLLLTVALLIWTIIWIHNTNRIRTKFAEVARDAVGSIYHKFLLIAMIAFTIFRELVEIIIFIYGIVSAHKLLATQYVFSLLAGALFGALVGYLAYRGLLLPRVYKYIFKVSTVLLTFISSNLSAEAAKILTSSGIVDKFSYKMWDTSSFILDSSILGRTLRFLLGYRAKPSALEVIFYFSSIFIVVLCIVFNRNMQVKVNSNLGKSF